MPFRVGRTRIPLPTMGRPFPDPAHAATPGGPWVRPSQVPDCQAAAMLFRLSASAIVWRGGMFEVLRSKPDTTMNTFLKPMRNAAMLGMMALLFTQCSSPGNTDEMEARAAAEAEADRIREEIRAERDAFSRDLEAKRAELDRRLAELDAELADTKLNKELREAKEATRAEVAEQKSAVEKAWNDVTNATEETWRDVKDGVSKAATDVGDWFTRQADKVDEATKADADKDGK
jgi:hypothetical protein